MINEEELENQMIEDINSNCSEIEETEELALGIVDEEIEIVEEV